MKINIAKIDFKHWMNNFINISGVDFADQKKEPTPTSSSMYFTLEEGQTEATISYSNTYQSLHNKNLQFSYDDQNWEDWTGAKTIYAGEKLYVRGLDDYVLDNKASIGNKFFTISQGYVECHGNIMSLCNNSNIIKETSFCSLFYGTTYLKTAPDIIADEVESSGCLGMFEGCSNLKSIDKIDVKKAGISGFARMFYKCSSLVNIPSILPATTLGNNCCYYMFAECTSLTTAPELAATELDYSCCDSMFFNCSNLVKAPTKLPATQLADYCYIGMFKNCTSLVTAPELPATTLTNQCYSSMFQGCTSLTVAPELPATTLATYCYENMFSLCSSLVTAPELPATTLATYCYSTMFYSCSSLVRAPYLPAPQLVRNCYKHMFMYCSKLSYIKADILKGLSGALSDWVKGVSETGVYEKPVSSDFNDRGASGIPEGWTIKTY